MNNNIAPFSNLIIDMDGVLWRGETPLPGLVDFFMTLDQLGINFVLATNNATKTASQYMEKIAGFGVVIPAEQILTSSEATARYLRHRFPDGTPVYVVGENGLYSALEDQGFEILRDDGFVGADARVEIVVVGMTRHVCYKHLASAAHLINHGALFVGTNPDVTFPTEVGPLPGAGSIIAFLKTATDKEPIVIGKPNQGIFVEAMRRMNGTPADTIVVGDRLNTDISGGLAAGLRTILLLTGITKSEDLESAFVKPDWIFENLLELNIFLREIRA